MGNQKLKRLYVFDRQRLMNADQKIKKKVGAKDGENDSDFPALVPFSLGSKKPKRRLILRDDGY